MEPSNPNRDAYDAIAARWDASRTAIRPKEAPWIARFTAALSPHARVLDLGCGTGRPIARHLVACGHRITGVDQSAAMLALARARLPAESWVLAALETFVPPPSPGFGGAIAWDALFHVARSHHAVIFARVRAALSAGAPFALTVGGSAQPPFTDTMFDHTFAYDSHPPEIAVALVEAAGFEIVARDFLDPPTTGRDKGRYVIVAQAA
jgi:trans-aconitate methyltransferase